MRGHCRGWMPLAPVLAAFALLAGCGGDPATAPDPGPDAGPGPGPMPGPPPSFWYVQTTFATPDGRTSFLQLIASPDQERVTTDNAIELPGNARVFVDGNRIYTGSAEAPVIQRWFAETDGSLTPGERLSFAATGLNAIPFGNNFISPDKAYLFDRFRVLMWNPTTLTLAGEIDLSSLVMPEFVPEIDPGILRGDLLFAVVQQQDFAGDFNRGIQVVVIDTTRDEIAAVLEDDRCIGSFAGMALAEDGSIYVLGDNYLLRHWFVDDLPPSCLLRILPDAPEFDPEFFVDFNAAVGGQPCVGLFYRGDGLFLTNAVDETLSTVDPRDAPLTFLNEPVSTWWEIDIADPVSGRELGLGAVSPRNGPAFEVDGRQFIQEPLAAFTGENTLIEIVEGNRLVERFSTAGLITGLGRVEAEP
ncbi:MAG: hypothetical protein AAF500_14115 [Myxococcota bacterium]